MKLTIVAPIISTFHGVCSESRGWNGLTDSRSWHGGGSCSVDNVGTCLRFDFVFIESGFTKPARSSANSKG